MNTHTPLPDSSKNRDDPLQTAVFRLAETMAYFSDADLDQPWSWGPHNEGVRFALLGTYQELRELAVHVADQRRITQPLTTAQHALAQYHAAYRDWQALFLGVDEALFDRAPAPSEWPLITIIEHIVRAERGFFTLVHYGLRRQRETGDLPERLPEGEVDRVLGPLVQMDDGEANVGLREILVAYDRLHRRALTEFAMMTGEELGGPSLWWEDIRYPLQHRLHRFDAHLRQHSVQIEKTLDSLDVAPAEARRLLRLVFNALAEVEGLLIGAPDLAAGERYDLSVTIAERAAIIADLVGQAHQLEKAVKEGDEQTVREILDAYPTLVDAQDQQRQPLILTAAYRSQPGIVDIFQELEAEMSIFEAAAVGDLAQVRAIGEQWPEDIVAFGRDGFTPLQLACYFGHQDIVEWLLAHGADVTSVSQNDQHLQAIHAATANNSLAITRLLLAHNADANARQQNGFRPLHAAVQHGNQDLAGLLLDYGADPQLANDQGKTALDFTEDANLIALLTK